MNLIQGRLVPAKDMPGVMQRLERDLAATLQKPPPGVDMVVDACDRLRGQLPASLVLPVLTGALGFGQAQAEAQYTALQQMFSREYLEERLTVELGGMGGKANTRTPHGLQGEVCEALYPLGVLFHIAAGNMDGLPVYSVIEGLLAGNINLLKLPSVDGGLSVLLLQKLFEVEPRLAEYVYVFELSSKETSPVRQLAELADAVVVWGGDEAVASVRRLAPPNTRIIEWGHKLSFAYVTPEGATEALLQGLAHNICSTNQLLCSSCQGIYLDTEDEAQAEGFCQSFLPVLQRVAKQYPAVPLSARAQNTLQLYSRGLEGAYGGAARIYKGDGVSLVLERDGQLTVSLQFRSVWVRLLPQAQIVARLHPYKNHLQTAALLCTESEWEPLRDKLWRAGVVRVSGGAEMSESYCGSAHDGEYPLRRYMRVVSAQK